MAKFIEHNSIQAKKKSFWYFFFKRAFDIFFSFLFLVLFSWFLIIIGLLVFFTNPGHIIFFDKRIGKNGKTISVWKFRSMYADSETRPEKYLNEKQLEQWKRERKVLNDPRITPFGRFLRKTSIDELPQFVNIFIGNMSFVGPRPITAAEIEENFTEEQKEVLFQAKPGLTGLWQVSGRSDVTWESGDRQKLELQYLQTRGIGKDLAILFKTIPAVLNKKGAH